MRTKSHEYLWVEVTQDKYRHIIKMAESPEELARMCGVKRTTVASTACRVRNGQNPKGRFERVYVGKDRQIWECDSGSTDEC